MYIVDTRDDDQCFTKKCHIVTYASTYVMYHTCLKQSVSIIHHSFSIEWSKSTSCVGVNAYLVNTFLRKFHSSTQMINISENNLGNLLFTSDMLILTFLQGFYKDWCINSSTQKCTLFEESTLGRKTCFLTKSFQHQSLFHLLYTTYPFQL